jgi:hypothetical protein
VAFDAFVHPVKIYKLKKLHFLKKNCFFKAFKAISGPQMLLPLNYGQPVIFSL